jgi:hypothetical protein
MGRAVHKFHVPKNVLLSENLSYFHLQQKLQKEGNLDA